MKFTILFLFAIVAIVNCQETEGDRRITGGTNAVPGQFPWHARLEPFNGITRRICGGALIRYNWVLTAAQCIYGARDIIVRLGIVNILGGGGTSFLVRNANHIITYPNYNGDVEHSIFQNDIGLVFIAGASESILSNTINTVPLPNPYANFTDSFGLATGFGLTEDGNNAVQSMVLQFALLPIITREACRQQHGTSVITDNHICANSFGGSSTCAGDEGAPLITYINLNPVLVGIGSTPLKLCTQGYAAIFTDVPRYIDWINRVIAFTPFNL
ncbi:brachyurin-like [Chironomus tepperi]|uniref:brachyurin-like n=1 Tax=Chironomus tepperi TaxID=113505 RepID=UPI00391F879E